MLRRDFLKLMGAITLGGLTFQTIKLFPGDNTNIDVVLRLGTDGQNSLSKANDVDSYVGCKNGKSVEFGKLKSMSVEYSSALNIPDNVTEIFIEAHVSVINSDALDFLQEGDRFACSKRIITPDVPVAITTMNPAEGLDFVIITLYSCRVEFDKESSIVKIRTNGDGGEFASLYASPMQRGIPMSALVTA